MIIINLRIPRALLVIVYFLPGVAATIRRKIYYSLCRGQFAVPIPIPILAVVLVAITIFGIVMPVIVRALCLAMPIIEFLSVGVRVRLTNAAIALVSRDIRDGVCSGRGIAARAPESETQTFLDQGIYSATQKTPPGESAFAACSLHDRSGA